MPDHKTSKSQTGYKLRKSLSIAVVYGFIGLNLIWVIFPIYWIFLTSLKTNQQINSIPPLFIFKPTLDTYSKLISGDAILAFRNSLIISILAVLIGLLVSFPAAYTLARVKFRAKNQANFYILSMRMAPAFAFLIPYYLIFRLLKMIDTFPALVIIYLTITIPFGIWMLESVVADMPIEIEEAALVDGCTPIQVMWKIVVPITAPSIAATGILIRLLLE